MRSPLPYKARLIAGCSEVEPSSHGLVNACAAFPSEAHAAHRYAWVNNSATCCENTSPLSAACAVNTASSRSYARVPDWDRARLQSIRWKLAGYAPKGVRRCDRGNGGFRDLRIPEAQFPRRTLLGNPVNKPASYAPVPDRYAGV